MSEYETRQKLQEKNEGYEEAMGLILDEVQKPNPDIGFIEETASEALGISEEIEIDSDSDEDEDEDEDEDDD